MSENNDNGIKDGNKASKEKAKRAEALEDFCIAFSTFLFNEPGPCRLCSEILRGLSDKTKVTLYQLCYSNPHNHTKSSDDGIVPDFLETLSRMGKGKILPDVSPDDCLEISYGGSNLKLCFRGLGEPEIVRKRYNELKASKSVPKRGKPCTHLPCLLNLRKADGTLNTSQVNQLKHLWEKLSRELINLYSAKDREELLESILTIYNIRKYLIQTRIGEQCIRLNSSVMQMDRMILPAISSKGGKDFKACKAHYLLLAYSICNYLRLCLLGQKSDPDVVILGKKDHENNAGPGDDLWQKQSQVAKPVCPQFGESIQNIFLCNSLPEHEKQDFHDQVLKMLLRIDSPKKIKQLGLTQFQCQSQVIRIFFGIENDVYEPMDSHLGVRGYYFVPESRIKKRTLDDELADELKTSNARSIYPVVISDSTNKKMPRLRKKFQKLKIDRYYWYLPGTEYSGQTFVELPTFARRFWSEEDHWILDALNSLKWKAQEIYQNETDKVLTAEAAWPYEIQMKRNRVLAGGKFYSTGAYNWQKEVFSTAKFILVGRQPTIIDDPQHYRLMLQASFSGVGQYLAEVFGKKIEDLPAYFQHPMKSLRGGRIPKKWYQLPSDATWQSDGEGKSRKKCQDVQYSNSAGYLALSLAIAGYFQSNGKKVASEDDILYAKRAIMLRLRRLYNKLEKKVQKTNKPLSENGEQDSVTKDMILLHFDDEWGKVMFTPVKGHAGRQRRRKTDYHIGEEVREP